MPQAAQMSPVPDASGQTSSVEQASRLGLEQAFALFNQMSNQLSESYSMLEDRVAELKGQLAFAFAIPKQADAIANREGILDANDFLLIKLAALYHDTGFLEVYKGHEEVSCVKATRELTAVGLGDAAIQRICGMIMATKIPQQPHNLLEQILADADLDYLGRTDFFPISNKLRTEFIDHKIVNTNVDGIMTEIIVPIPAFLSYF
mgnify:CR=1 FL=1